MMSQRMLYLLMAGAFGALTMTATADTVAPAHDNSKGSVSQSNADEDQLPATKDEKSIGTDDSSGTKNAKKHPPTAVMDRATPTQKAPSGQTTEKHPPTNRMDQVTPEEKSPGANTTESQGGSETAPSSTK